MSDHIQIISKKPHFQNDFLKLYEVELQLPNGKTKIHYNVERVPVVSVVPITPTGEVYLIYNYRYLLGRTVLETVAGTVDPGEKPLAAAKRELAEEAGIQAKGWKQLRVVFLAGSYIKAEVTIFMAYELKIGKPNPQEDEQIQVVKMPLQEAVNKILNGKIMMAPSIIGLLMVDKLKQGRRI